jgi:hypothetical protein
MPRAQGFSEQGCGQGSVSTLHREALNRGRADGVAAREQAVRGDAAGQRRAPHGKQRSQNAYSFLPVELLG